MRDRCDPETFNAAIGPDTCVREGSSGGFVTFDRFFATLEERRPHGAWRFTPEATRVDAGRNLLVENTGGEFHTFTAVSRFGVGCVPEINELLFGDPAVSPLCTGATFAASGVNAGDRRTFAGPDRGVQRYQCLIHPWMKSKIRARSR